MYTLLVNLSRPVRGKKDLSIHDSREMTTAKRAKSWIGKLGIGKSIVTDLLVPARSWFKANVRPYFLLFINIPVGC